MATTTPKAMTTNDSPIRPAVALYRVSTARQGQSGLGLEAQQQAVQRLISQLGLTLTAEFTEVESGTKRQQDRPQLAAALAEARRVSGTLVVAKLDRLARDAELILRLAREAEQNGMAGIRFADLPDIDCSSSTGRLILGVMASLAEWEAKRISERTIAALAARKASGRPMGADLPHVQQANARRSAAALEQAKGWAFLVLPMRQDGLSFQAIADRLHDQQTPTPSGHGRWTAAAVRRVLQRLEQASQDASQP